MSETHRNEVASELAAIYDRFAERYDHNRDLFDMTAIIDAFGQRLPQNGRLLDLGCGAGEPFARHFASRGWSVTGVDLSQRMLELARKHVPGIEVIQADMCAIDFPPGQFDAVTSIYSFFHVPRRHHARLFAACQRWLRPGGHFLFTYATRDWTGADSFDGYKEFMGERLFYSHDRVEDLDALLRAHRFDVVAFDHHDIGGEHFLWVTVRKPDESE